MTNEEIEKLVHMNQRLFLLLGYGSSFIHEFKEKICNNERGKKQYDWYMKAIENLVYLDKPLPPAP